MLGFGIDLAPGLGTVFDVVQGAVDTVFFDRILRDLQAGLRFLSLLLDAAGIDAVDRKIVVVAGAASETNRSLVAAPIVLRERSQQREGGPIAPIVRKIRNLIRPYYGPGLGRRAVLQFGRSHLDPLVRRTDGKLNVQGV